MKRKEFIKTAAAGVAGCAVGCGLSAVNAAAKPDAGMIRSVVEGKSHEERVAFIATYRPRPDLPTMAEQYAIDVTHLSEQAAMDLIVTLGYFCFWLRDACKCADYCFNGQDCCIA